MDDPRRTLAFIRVYEGEVAVVAICAGDTSVSLDLAVDNVADGMVFIDVLTRQSHVISGGRLQVRSLGAGEACILVSDA